VVERLFKAAGQILNPIGAARSLSDVHFDWMVFIQDLQKNATDRNIGT
jgi:hypothetical protein